MDIYTVVAEIAEWDDSCHWVVASFTSFEAAEGHAKLAQGWVDKAGKMIGAIPTNIESPYDKKARNCGSSHLIEYAVEKTTLLDSPQPINSKGTPTCEVSFEKASGEPLSESFKN